jgi:hypothetical protein
MEWLKLILAGACGRVGTCCEEKGGSCFIPGVRGYMERCVIVQVSVLVFAVMVLLAE